MLRVTTLFYLDLAAQTSAGTLYFYSYTLTL